MATAKRAGGTARRPTSRTRPARPARPDPDEREDDFEPRDGVDEPDGTDGPDEPDDPDELDGVFDLDALDDEGDVHAVFVFKAKGQVFEAAHPEDLDWRTTNRIAVAANHGDEDMEELLKAVLRGQFDEFAALHVPTRRVTALFEEWRRFHGLPKQGNALASPGSSRGTGTRSRRTSRRRG